MDYEESPEEGIIRETFEETSLIIELKNLLFLNYVNEIFPEENKHYVNLVFIATKADGEPKVMEPDKCEFWKWYDPFNLPKDTFINIKNNIENNEKIMKELIYGKSFINFYKKIYEYRI